MYAGEVPIAFVARSPKSLITEEDIQKFIAKQVDSTDAGKLLRRELVQQVRSKM